MNCAGYEALIALYVENDLTEEETRQVVAHIEACDACRQFAAGLRESQAAFKALKFESVDEAVYSDVRAEVLRAFSAPRRSRVWRRYTIAAAVALALVAGWMWRMRPGAVVEPPSAVAARAPQAPLVLAHAPVKPRNRVRRVSRRLRAKPSFKSEPLLVKMLTDDPDVVIYWLVDQNGG